MKRLVCAVADYLQNVNLSVRHGVKDGSNVFHSVDCLNHFHFLFFRVAEFYHTNRHLSSLFLKIFMP